MEPRYRAGKTLREESQGRHGLDQHLWLYRCAVAVGRRARFRLRPRTRLGRDREFHRAEGGLDEPERLSYLVTAARSARAGRAVLFPPARRAPPAKLERDDLRLHHHRRLSP